MKIRADCHKKDYIKKVFINNYFNYFIGLSMNVNKMRVVHLQLLILIINKTVINLKILMLTLMK